MPQYRPHMNPFLSIFTDVPELQVRLREYAQDARNAFAENTILVMERDLRKFSVWCANRKVSALLANPDIVRDYVDWCAETLKPATVSRYLASIAHLHRAAHFPDPTKDNKVAPLVNFRPAMINLSLYFWLAYCHCDKTIFVFSYVEFFKMLSQRVEII